MMHPSLVVIAACFHGLREYEALKGLPHLQALDVRLANDRVGLMRKVMAIRPAAVVFPICDWNGVPSAPLISRLRSDAPDVSIGVLLHADSPAHGLREALRAGAAICTWDTTDTLVTAVHSLAGLDAMAVPEPRLLGALIDGFRPELCVRVLLHCAVHAHRRLRVEDVSAELQVSRRTLNRWMRSNSWPSPSEVIEWGRLFRASLIHWQSAGSSTALARAAGFASATALSRCASRMIDSGLPHTSALTPLHVTTSFRHRLDDLVRPF